MKHLYISLALLATALTANAGTYDYLTFENTDGKQVSMSVNGLKMRIADGNLVAANGEGTMTFALADLSKMLFTETSGIADNVMSDSKAVTVYNLSGVKIGEYQNADSAQKALDKGVYVVKASEKTYKMTVK